MSDCPNCEYHKESARMWRQEAQKEWVGLTDEEIDWILGLAYADDMELIKTIETKLKDKNG